MARAVSSIGLQGEVSFGATGYLHKNNNWRGASDSTVAAGTGQPGVSTAYIVGDLVVHAGFVWVANHASDNVAPGSTYDLDGTGLPMNSTPGTYWTQVGSADTTEAVSTVTTGPFPVMASAAAGTGPNPQGTQTLEFTGDNASANIVAFFRIFGVPVGTNYIPDAGTTNNSLVIPSNVTINPNPVTIDPGGGAAPLTFTLQSGDSVFRIAENTVQFRAQGAQGTVTAFAGMLPALTATAMIDQDRGMGNEAEEQIRFTTEGPDASRGNRVQINQNNYVTVDVQHDGSLEINDANNELGTVVSAAPGNILASDTSNGLFVNAPVDAVTGGTGPITSSSAAANGVDTVTLGIRTDDSLHLVANADDAANMDLSVQVVGNTGDNAINALMETTAGLRADVATWARTETGGVMIPLAKLPNLQLGNTHTYTSRTAAEANAAGGAVGAGTTERVTWHTGDLLVLTSAAGADAGIYVFITASQAAPAPVVLGTNFRAVVSSNSQVQTTFTSSGLSPDTQNVTGQQLSNISYSAGDDTITFTAGTTPVTVPVNQVEIPDPTITPTAFFNRLKVGETTYAFGDQPRPATLSFNPLIAPINLFSAGPQTASFAFVAGRSPDQVDGTADPTISERDNPAITPAAGRTFVGTATVADPIVGNNVMVTVPALQTDADATIAVTAEADVSFNHLGVGVVDGDLRASGTVDFVDARRQPTFNQAETRSISSLSGGQQGYTINFTGGGSIAAGTAFDSTAYVIDSGTATRVTNESFVIPPSNTNQSSVISFPAPATRMNSQTGTPRNRTITINRFNPWFIGTAAAAPTTNQELVDATGLRQQGNAIGNRTNFPVTGTVGQDVFILTPAVTNINLRVTANGQPTSANTDGIAVGTVEVTAAVGTITYTVYQFAGLADSPTTFNITVTP